MLHRHLSLGVVSFLIPLIDCGGSSWARPRPGVLAAYNLRAEKPRTINLPASLAELSGIVEARPGTFFAHNDERGEIFEIDAKSGAPVKRFCVGEPVLRNDFEDIAKVGERMFLVTSSGTLYEFSEGRDGEHVAYRAYPTKLSRQNNVEGLCYDPSTQSLLLACKGSAGKKHPDTRAVYAFSLAEMKLEGTPRFLISLEHLSTEYGLVAFKPTSMVRDAASGAYLLLSSIVPAVIELSSEGDVVGCVRLPKRLHRQPEAMTLTGDGTLLVGDEGSFKGRVAFYPATPK